MALAESGKMKKNDEMKRGNEELDFHVLISPSISLFPARQLGKVKLKTKVDKKRATTSKHYGQTSCGQACNRKWSEDIVTSSLVNSSICNRAQIPGVTTWDSL